MRRRCARAGRHPSSRRAPAGGSHPGSSSAATAPGSRSLDALMDVDDESYARCADALAGFDRTGSVAGVAGPDAAGLRRARRGDDARVDAAARRGLPARHARHARLDLAPGRPRGAGDGGRALRDHLAGPRRRRRARSRDGRAARRPRRRPRRCGARGDDAGDGRASRTSPPATRGARCGADPVCPAASGRSRPSRAWSPAVTRRSCGCTCGRPCATASNPTRSRRSSCTPPSTRACRRRTLPWPSPARSSPTRIPEGRTRWTRPSRRLTRPSPTSASGCLAGRRRLRVCRVCRSPSSARCSPAGSTTSRWCRTTAASTAGVWASCSRPAGSVGSWPATSARTRSSPGST